MSGNSQKMWRFSADILCGHPHRGEQFFQFNSELKTWLLLVLGTFTPISVFLLLFLANLSNGRAIVMVVIRLSVMDVLWLNGARQGLGCY